MYYLGKLTTWVYCRTWWFQWLLHSLYSEIQATLVLQFIENKCKRSCWQQPVVPGNVSARLCRRGLLAQQGPRWSHCYSAGPIRSSCCHDRWLILFTIFKTGILWFRLVFLGLHRTSYKAVDIFYKFQVCSISKGVCWARRELELKQVGLHSLVALGFFLIEIITVMESSAQYCGKGLKNMELCT